MPLRCGYAKEEKTTARRSTFETAGTGHINPEPGLQARLSKSSITTQTDPPLYSYKYLPSPWGVLPSGEARFYHMIRNSELVIRHSRPSSRALSTQRRQFIEAQMRVASGPSSGMGSKNKKAGPKAKNFRVSSSKHPCKIIYEHQTQDPGVKKKYTH